MARLQKEREQLRTVAMRQLQAFMVRQMKGDTAMRVAVWRQRQVDSEAARAAYEVRALLKAIPKPEPKLKAKSEPSVYLRRGSGRTDWRLGSAPWVP